MSSVGIAHHTSRKRGTWTDDHGTPPEIIELVRSMFGSIDVDLASSRKHNEVVGAVEFYSMERPCPDVIAVDEVTFCNPPGPLVNVKLFFHRWQAARRGAFLIYNIDHWRCLTPTKILYALVLRKRLRFTGAKHQANFSSVLVTTHRPPRGWGHVLRWSQ